MAYRYRILDVFTATPLTGNALAVVMESDGLDDARMQAIAREFNLSETVFVQKAERPVHSAKLRIFTPTMELPFAGHPTVGTALALAIDKLNSEPGDTLLVLEEKVGPVRCAAFVKSAGHGHAIFDLPKKPEQIEVSLDREMIAAALGLTPSEVGFENHVPSVYSAGVPYVFVPVRNLDAIGKARPVSAAWNGAVGNISDAMYLYCRQTMTAGNQFHARCFVSGAGIGEDAATGGAAAGFAGVVRRFDEPTAGNHRLLIEQGIEIQRPSLIALEIDIEGGAVTAARIGGDAIVVAEGRLDID